MLKFKNGLLALMVALAGLGMVTTSTDVEAKRLGGGRPAGMQRQMPAKQPSATPDGAGNAVKPAPQPGNTAAPAQVPPQPGKRSWMGPLAGLAAGLGIAALASHFGLGGALANFMTMALLAVVGVMVVSWLMRRFANKPAASAGPQWAGAGAPFDAGQAQGHGNLGMQREAAPQAPVQPMAPAAASGAALASGGASAAALSALPAGFDVPGFERIAKMIFIRMQAANDAGNVDDLRKFTTPELFASLRLDLQERGPSAQQTDVMQLDAEVVDTAQENGQLVATVRFHGLIREEVQAGAQPFNELWHLVKPTAEGAAQSEWAIAGITPLDA